MAAVQQYTKRLIATDGTYTNTANWSGGVLPVENDNVLLHTSGFDLATVSGEIAIDLESLEVAESFRHKIGGSGDRYTILVQSGGAGQNGTGQTIYAGSGPEAWFTIDTKRFVARHQVYGDNACVLTHATNNIDEIVQESGLLKLDGGVYPIINVVGINPTRCVIDAGSTLTTVTLSGGTIACSATDTITTLNIHGGTFEHLVAEPITTLNITGGFFRWDGEETIGTVNHYGGTIDMSRTAVPKTITQYNGFGGVLDLGGVGNPIFTALNVSPTVQVIESAKLRVAS